MKQSLFQTFWQAAVDLMADIFRSMNKGFSFLLASLLLLCSLSLHAEAPLLPPTFLFLDAQQQEIRSLRLTGAFNESTLLNQLQQLQTTQESSP